MSALVGTRQLAPRRLAVAQVGDFVTIDTLNAKYATIQLTAWYGADTTSLVVKVYKSVNGRVAQEAASLNASPWQTDSIDLSGIGELRVEVGTAGASGYLDVWFLLKNES